MLQPKKIKRSRPQREQMRNVVRAYLEDHPCTHCGFSDPRALEFHHRDPTTKVAEIGSLVNQGGPLHAILLEIQKCDVLCRNCHAIHHRKREGWFIREYDLVDTKATA